MRIRKFVYQCDSFIASSPLQNESPVHPMTVAFRCQGLFRNLTGDHNLAKHKISLEKLQSTIVIQTHENIEILGQQSQTTHQPILQPNHPPKIRHEIPEHRGQGIDHNQSDLLELFLHQRVQVKDHLEESFRCPCCVMMEHLGKSPFLVAQLEYSAFVDI